MQEIDNTRKWIATKCGRDYTVLDADADADADADEAGQIRIGSTTLTGGHKISDGLWESDDQAYLYVQRGADLLIGQRTVAGATTISSTYSLGALRGTENDGDQNAIKSIATKAYSTRDKGQFDQAMQAANATYWRTEA